MTILFKPPKVQINRATLEQRSSWSPTSQEILKLLSTYCVLIWEGSAGYTHLHL